MNHPLQRRQRPPSLLPYLAQRVQEKEFVCLARDAGRRHKIRFNNRGYATRRYSVSFTQFRTLTPDIHKLNHLRGWVPGSRKRPYRQNRFLVLQNQQHTTSGHIECCESEGGVSEDPVSAGVPRWKVHYINLLLRLTRKGQKQGCQSASQQRTPHDDTPEKTPVLQ